MAAEHEQVGKAAVLNPERFAFDADEGRAEIGGPSEGEEHPVRAGRVRASGSRRCCSMRPSHGLRFLRLPPRQPEEFRGAE